MSFSARVHQRPLDAAAGTYDELIWARLTKHLTAYVNQALGWLHHLTDPCLCLRGDSKGTAALFHMNISPCFHSSFISAPSAVVINTDKGDGSSTHNLTCVPIKTGGVITHEETRALPVCTCTGSTPLPIKQLTRHSCVWRHFPGWMPDEYFIRMPTATFGNGGRPLWGDQLGLIISSH